MNDDGHNARNASNGKPASHASHASHSSPPSERLLPPRGDYQTLLSFQKAEVVYDITYRFAHKFLAKGDRTVDQMIQSARSGKQNIVEGSKAALTSKETQIKLTNVARASLEELLADYRDYLRVRDHAICLIHQTNYLIDQQLRRLERDFLREGGLRERMTRLRLQHRCLFKATHGTKGIRQVLQRAP